MVGNIATVKNKVIIVNVDYQVTPICMERFKLSDATHCPGNVRLHSDDSSSRR
ncbi:hypothetical protein [Urbanus proteus nucleopolyhedrovirus]|uniref:Uncharacterized protein n=1 Tax=Urbanus proteus nucleopolyhedrovirus TaxID=1675866 RepID=A0A161C6V6_9ABAC|nr:hypothetical protein [Urbanus proteus nucleopolyhedrovirus]AKR17295.1 hypothetical protein [Urbanus proteus nucleopolyhedrovirus]